jgi:Domain of unknown function (DUF4390)
MADFGCSRNADRRSAGTLIVHSRLHNKNKKSKSKRCGQFTSSSIFFFLSVFALLGLAPFRGLAQETTLVIDSLRLKENYLLVDFHADSLLTRQLLNGMQRGLTSSALYRVQLWRKRGFLFGSTLLVERQYEIKSTYDPWEQKYVIITAEERRLTSALDLVRRWWEQHHGVALTEQKNLNPSRQHFVTIDLQIEPVSKESLNEIRGWLAGEVKSGAKPDSTDLSNATEEKGRDIPDRLLNFLVNVTGFGKRVISVKSPNFRITERGEIVWEK